MTEKTFSRLFLDNLWNSLLTAVFAGIIAIVVNYAFAEKAEVHIHDSVKSSTNLYISSISITNYQKDKTIKSVEILSLADLQFEYIEGNLTSVQLANNNRIAIQNTPPDAVTTFILYSRDPIDKDNVRIVSDVKTVVAWTNSSLSSGAIRILYVLSMSIISGLTSLISGIVVDKRHAARVKKSHEKLESVEQTLSTYQHYLDDAHDRQKEVNKRVEKVLLEYKKLKRYSFTVIRHYDKELTFWRDTIRKLLYDAKDDQLRAEQLFNEVTKSLGTHATRTRGKYSADDVLEIIALSEELDLSVDTKSSMTPQSSEYVENGRTDGCD